MFEPLILRIINESLTLLTLAAGVSVIPAIFLGAYLWHRRRPDAPQLAMVTLVSGLLAVGVVWFGGDIQHLDCGNNCTPDVVSYSTIYVYTAAMLMIWGAIGWWAVRDSHRPKA